MARKQSNFWKSCPAAAREVLEVSEQVFSRLAFGQRAEGIVAVAAVPPQRLGDLVLPEDPLVAVLEGVEKPGNIGAVLRSADGAGVSALVLADPRTDLFNPNAIRASLGTVFTLPVATAAADEVLALLRIQKLQIVAAAWKDRSNTPKSTIVGRRRSFWAARPGGLVRSGRPTTPARSACRCSARPTV